MAKSAEQLFKEKIDPSQIGNPQLRQQLRRLYQQNYAEQLAEVNANYQAWRASNTDAQGNVAPISDYFSEVNAGVQAGLDAGLTRPQAVGRANSQYTVRDGDNLNTIANANNTTPDAILSANPDMTAPATGMVINTPLPAAYLQSERSSTPGGGLGLPSNAANNGANTNPTGFNPYAGATPAQLQAWGTGIGNARNATPVNLSRPSNPWTGPSTSSTAWTGAQPNNTAWTGAPSSAPTTTSQPFGAPGTPATTAHTQPAVLSGTFASNTAANIRRNTTQRGVNNLIERVADPDYTPSEREMQVLLHYQLARPSQPAANGGIYGNYSFGSVAARRFAGGGGGGGRAPGGGGQGRPPAFSQGGGFRGLVNWRI